jgi:hypothetical protein
LQEGIDGRGGRKKERKEGRKEGRKGLKEGIAGRD